jgi:hypothetical protein
MFKNLYDNSKPTMKNVSQDNMYPIQQSNQVWNINMNNYICLYNSQS